MSKFNYASISIIRDTPPKELLGADQINEDQIFFMNDLYKALLSRHECLKVIEETIINDKILLKFFIATSIHIQTNLEENLRAPPLKLDWAKYQNVFMNMNLKIWEAMIKHYLMNFKNLKVKMLLLKINLN